MIDNDLYCGATDVGLKRETNQDQFLIAQLNKSMLVGATSLPMDTADRLYGDTQGHLMLVADGMGGHAGGEHASMMAIDILVKQLLNNVHWFFKIGYEAEREFIESLKSMLRNTHDRIQAAGKQAASLNGMGTTLTMAYLIWPKLYVLHAGDSRCYLVRKGMAERLTTDHTLARRMIDKGEMNVEEESTSRLSNVLWNVLGGRSESELTAEVRCVTLQEDDAIMICSDGLHRHVNEAQIVEVLDNNFSAQDACKKFIKIANSAGGDDNITVIVARPELPPGLSSTLIIESQTPDNPFGFDTHNPHDTLPG